MIFLLLLFANVGLFAWRYFAAEQPPPAATLRALEVSPERIRIVRPAEAPDAPKPAAPLPAAAPSPTASAPTPTASGGTSAACLEWGAFAGADIQKAEAAIATLGLPAVSVKSGVADNAGYWVYMPPFKTRAEVDRKLVELKALGVTELYVVQDPPQWRNAISLGIFRAEDAAQGHLATLKEKGVRTAVVGKRDNLVRQIAFYIRDPGEPVVARLTELQRQFPGTEIKAAACPG